MEHTVAVLFARSDSVYKTLPGCDVYDKERDARNYAGGLPVICHPPCRSWGRLRAFAKPEPGERDLAKWSVELVRKHGGILEHPEKSTLWADQGLPLGREIDEWDGYTISVDQFWWGHRARKRTWLYIVGIDRSELPPTPLKFDAITHTVGKTMKRGRVNFSPKPPITAAEREHTPIELAKWLIGVAEKTNVLITQ